MIKLKFLMLGFVFLLFCNFAFAIDDLIAFQGNVKEGGSNLALGDLRVYIYDAPTGGNLIYDSLNDFDDAVVDGKYDVMLGNGSVLLSLEYGKKYYLGMSVNGENFTFNGEDRQIFQSSVGNISFDFIDASDKIVLTNQSVVFDNNVNISVSSGGWFKGWFDWVVDSLSLNWLSFDGQTLKFNETHLNLTIDSRASFYNDTAFISNVNDSLWNYIGSNEGSWLSTYNSTYALYSYNHTEETMNLIGVGGYLVNDDVAQLHSLNVTNVLRVGSTTLYADLSGLNITGVVNFNGGWTDNGVSVIDGDIFAQRLYVYNITSLAVNDLNINGSIIPQFDASFDVGSADKRYRDLYLSRNAVINGSVTINGVDVSTWLYNQTTGANSYTNSVNNSLASWISSNYLLSSIFISENTSIWNAINGISGGDFYLANFSSSFSSNISAWESLVNSSYLSTYNATYATWAYNQTTGAISYVDGQGFIKNNTNAYLASLGVGTVSPITKFHLQNSDLRIQTQIGASEATYGLAFTKSRGTESEPTVVSTGDYLGYIAGYGYNGTAFRQSSLIGFRSDGTTTAFTPGSILFSTSNGSVAPTVRMVIDSVGKIGIGTATPTHTLNVLGTANITGNTIIGGNLNATGDICIIGGNCLSSVSGGSGSLWATNGTAIYNSTVSQVGIGTATPLMSLDVQKNVSGSNFQAALFGNSVGAGVANSASTIYLSGQGSWGRSVFIQGLNTGGGNNAHSMVFGVSSANSAPTERMRIDSSGSLGIGTTTPDRTLTVNGNANISGNLYVNSTRIGIGTAMPATTLDIATPSATTLTRLIKLGGPSSTNAGSYIEFASSATVDGYGARIGGLRTAEFGGANALVFYTGGNAQLERMRINDGGNVGIGTTTPTQKLDVAGNINMSTGSNFTTGRGQIYWDSSESRLVIRVS